MNDDGYFANPKYSLQFPPNSFNKDKLANQRIPVNAINVNSQLHPINTVTGLQYFTGLNSYPWREKAIPKVGLGTLFSLLLFLFKIHIFATRININHKAYNISVAGSLEWFLFHFIWKTMLKFGIIFCPFCLNKTILICMA